MDSRGETSGVIQVVEKVTGYARRGVASPRQAIDIIIDELVHYRRGDLAETVLTLLTPELVSELHRWTREVMQPDFRYRWFGVGSGLSETERQRVEAEMKVLASLFSRSAVHAEETRPETDISPPCSSP